MPDLHLYPPLPSRCRHNSYAAALASNRPLLYLITELTGFSVNESRTWQAVTCSVAEELSTRRRASTESLQMCRRIDMVQCRLAPVRGGSSTHRAGLIWPRMFCSNRATMACLPTIQSNILMSMHSEMSKLLLPVIASIPRSPSELSKSGVLPLPNEPSVELVTQG